MEEKKENAGIEGTAAPQQDISWIPQWKDGLIHTAEESHQRACNQEHMRALVLALRSGQWWQGHNMLRAFSDRYCCLGVACELAVQDGAARVLLRDSGGGWLYGPVGDEDPMDRMGQWSSTMLPPAVTKWLGVGGSSLYVVMPEQGRQWFIDHPECQWSQQYRYMISSLVQGGHMSVVGLNDDLRMPFSFIADCIEYTYLPGDWNTRVQTSG